MMLDLARWKMKQYSARYPGWMAGKPLLYVSCALASLGDALFGYSQGITAAFQQQPNFLLRMYGKHLSVAEIEIGETGVPPMIIAITVACLNITALLSSLLAAYVNDILGRRVCIRIGAVIYFIAALVQIFAMDLPWLIAGRSVQGIGVGMLSMTVPIFQCEISPSHSRGLFVSIEYLCLNCGYLLSAWVGYAFFMDYTSEASWRGPYGVQAAISLLLIVSSFLLPETPRWLIKNGFRNEGLWTLADLHGTGDVTDPTITRTYHEILNSLGYEGTDGKDASWLELPTKYGHRTFVGITSQMFAQLNGINAILHFLPENLGRAGFTVQRSLLYAGACAALYCGGTIPTIFGVDRYGRRIYLQLGSIGLAISLAVVGGLQFYADKLPEGFRRHDVANAIFAGVGVYLFTFGATWGPIPWLLGAEIFPIRARAKGAALANISDWLFNFIIAMITPSLFAAIPGGYYFLLVASCLISFVVAYLFYPETASKSLEELGDAFADGRHDKSWNRYAIAGSEDGMSSVNGSSLFVSAETMDDSQVTLASDGTVSEEKLTGSERKGNGEEVGTVERQ